ncbi:arginine--tRNA ligase [Dictyocaulus viviparus]|uniref:arginine--tRNA ligase n=1 Tax=Dictyocaulus viviparus TaxID=29172 RepID=A0A0D8XE38_DICVI|nr:arginine--tRNA ligase [Dictyocaulus viviparus]
MTHARFVMYVEDEGYERWSREKEMERLLRPTRVKMGRANNQIVYERLDIAIEDVGESFYQEMMFTLVSDMRKMHLENLREEEGRLLYFPKNCEVPLTIVKSDGGYTYDTSDLAALCYRLRNKKADWIIYVVDSGQSLHLETIFAVGRELGWYDESKQRVEHVAFGLVLGEDRKKFKTRSGDSVRLLDLLDEGLRRATAKLNEKGRTEFELESVLSEEELAAARDAVAYGCIKYSDLSHTRTQDYVFSFDRMLDDKGNTAVYLLYAYTRIRSIVRNSGVETTALKDFILQTSTISITHPAEINLSKQILKLSDCILQVVDSLMLHQKIENRNVSENRYLAASPSTPCDGIEFITPNIEQAKQMSVKQF